MAIQTRWSASETAPAVGRQSLLQGAERAYDQRSPRTAKRVKTLLKLGKHDVQGTEDVPGGVSVGASHV
ncbi:hypothetical protein [Marivita sp.]|uniref:hypothetical protein n=1 Tax=Marivita sp. TaxID=2003365 RepID=UPI003B524921